MHIRFINIKTWLKTSTHSLPWISKFSYLIPQISSCIFIDKLRTSDEFAEVKGHVKSIIVDFWDWIFRHDSGVKIENNTNFLECNTVMDVMSAQRPISHALILNHIILIVNFSCFTHWSINIFCSLFLSIFLSYI